MINIVTLSNCLSELSSISILNYPFSRELSGLPGWYLIELLLVYSTCMNLLLNIDLLVILFVW